ncbi:MAG: hypothetical protein OSJ35_08520 [Alistipes sp.]|nr:hypothetical protein [Alistipes sp.]
MKKKFFSGVAVILSIGSVFGQSLNLDMSPIKTTLRTFIPDAMGVVCLVALVGWTAFNLIKNWDNRQEIMTTFLWSLIGVLIAYGIVYMAMNALL